MHGLPLPELPYESDAWYEARRQSLGASEVAAALGFSPWHSAYSLWAEKTGRLGHPPANAAMELGKMLEPVILDGFERETGLRTYFRGNAWRHPDEEWATASPDALALESADDEGEPLGIVEAKTDFNVWDEVPEQYQLQVAWQMWVTGLDHAWIPLLATGHRQFRIYELERDERLIKVVVDAGREFWQYVTDDVEPPVDAHEATGRALSAVHSDPDDSEVEVDGEVVSALSELAEVKRRQKEIEERRAFLENTVKQALGDATSGLFGGRPVVTWKSQTSRTIDATRLKDERPDVAAEYVRESTFRVLRPKEIKT